ncbi:MAG: MMPL family transporter, partial [Bdellovibrionales bacterium]|nr:MMPL family transporter [Bdellovibrionales bacterium]
MNYRTFTTEIAIKHPKTVTSIMIGISFILAIITALPSLWPSAFPSLHGLKVDTDPENMLAHDEPVRAFHDKMKSEFSLWDMVVVGIVNDQHPEGVFNVKTLKNIYNLTEFAKTIQWDSTREANKKEGVIDVDIIAPSTVDSIEPEGLGTVRFEWLMSSPPTTEEEALAIRTKAQRLPFLNDTLVSGDGKAIAIYLPITSKDISYEVASKLQEKIDTFTGNAQYHITGLPVAEDTFGVQMFIQMAISAPLAMFIIFLLLLFFFRKLSLILSPLVVAVVSAICTMSLLISTGNTVHIMSSMIPIFVVPIAVLDAVHILSDFFDRYQKTKDRKATILHVMDTLFVPMLYTSLTTIAGFGSLALTEIPPVRVFGTFVALGVFFAWFWTILFIPAAIMLINEESLRGFGLVHTEGEDEHQGFISRLLHSIGNVATSAARPIVALLVILSIIAGYGISLIHVNDNPTKWFEPNHPIRVADKVLNSHFGGTYMSYLAFEATDGQNEDVFKQPEVLRYISQIQSHLTTSSEVVGKSNSLADLVKTVHRELFEGDEKAFRIPDSAAGVAQTLLTYESSHRPDDLWHFVTPDYQKTNLWLQLKSGDNQHMAEVVKDVNTYIEQNPPPVPLHHQWFGLTYINVVWQDKMVSGMLEAFLGSFVIVLIMMVILFRSLLWGILSMVPLSATILFIYGIIGLVGKDYDMPIAVLSSLSLGLAVDYAIHFIARARALEKKTGSWRATLGPLYGEPARAITRNVIVI